MSHLEHPCTEACEHPVALQHERGHPLRFELGPDGTPLDVVLWVHGTAHPITKPLSIIGRSPRLADVVIDHPFISRRGAVLRICPHGVSIEDTGSGTSVYLNKMAVARGGSRIFEGDEIVIGVFSVHLTQGWDPSVTPGG